MKRIGKTKNRVKSDLEVTIKTTDSKHAEIVTAIDLADSKKKKMEFDIGLKHQNLKRVFAKQKRLRNIWVFFDRREKNLLNQKIRTIRVLNVLDPFFINDDVETEPFENFAEMSINDYPELLDFDFSQFLKSFDFSSIPISAPATFQKQWTVAAGCFFKIRCYGLFPGFHHPGFVAYSNLSFFPLYQPMMMNCFPSCNLNIIHNVFCNGYIFSTFLAS